MDCEMISKSVKPVVARIPELESLLLQLVNRNKRGSQFDSTELPISTQSMKMSMSGLSSQIDAANVDLIDENRCVRIAKISGQISWYPTNAIDILAIKCLAAYPILLSSDHEYIDKVVYNPTLQTISSCLDTNKPIWYYLNDDKLQEGKRPEVFLTLSTQSVSNIVSLERPLEDLAFSWLCFHPEGLRRGQTLFTSKISKSPKYLPFFHFDVQVGGRIENELPLSTRKFYPISISGTGSEQALNSLSTVEMTVVVLESSLEFDKPEKIIYFGDHGSKNVIFSGQPYKTYEISRMDIEHRSGAGSVNLSHQFNLCFLDTAPSTIYVIWKEKLAVNSSSLEQEENCYWARAFSLGQIKF
jgi:hypothetical protein